MNTTYTEDCLKCGEPLLLKEIKSGERYHAACKRLVEAAARKERHADNIHAANKRAMR